MSSREASRQSSGELRSIIDAAHEAFISMDAGGFISDWNPHAERTFGWSREEAVGQVLADLIVPPALRDAHWNGLKRFLDTGEGPVFGKRLELAALHREGFEFPVEVTIAADTSGDRPSFHAFLHDISERKRAELYTAVQHAVTRALAGSDAPDEAAERLLPALAETLGWEVAAWWDIDEGRGQMRCREFWTRPELTGTDFERQTRQISFARGEGLPGRVWETGEPAIVDDVQADSNFPRAGSAAATGLLAAAAIPLIASGRVKGALEFMTGRAHLWDDRFRALLESLTFQIGSFLGILEQRASAVAKLQSLALTDELTGLANRRAWEQGLVREVSRVARDGGHLWVAVLDLDHFKAFNDARGHQAGDELLEKTARAWQRMVRATDLLTRYGGEEFALAFPAWPPEIALSVIERLRDAVPESQTCSAGLVVWNGQESADRLVARADAALYQAKRQGRNRTVMVE